MGMTNYPIIYLDLAAYVSDDYDDPKMLNRLKIEYAVIDDLYFLVIIS